VYGLELIGLRYFNVFGPKQDPNGSYAAVIPLFMKAVLNNEPPLINGDGEHSRDFTFVDNVVQANIKALFTNDSQALNQVYNIACGEQTTLNELFEHLKQIAGSDLAPKHGIERAGDVRHSLADISKAKMLLDYNPNISVKEGLKNAFEWYRSHHNFSYSI
jgi:UDP-N-acetylglucosamine 4-epimerase